MHQSSLWNPSALWGIEPSLFTPVYFFIFPSSKSTCISYITGWVEDLKTNQKNAGMQLRFSATCRSCSSPQCTCANSLEEVYFTINLRTKTPSSQRGKGGKRETDECVIQGGRSLSRCVQGMESSVWVAMCIEMDEGWLWRIPASPSCSGQSRGQRSRWQWHFELCWRPRPLWCRLSRLLCCPLWLGRGRRGTSLQLCLELGELLRAGECF